MRRNTLNGMQAIRFRARTVLKAAMVATALAFAGPLVGVGNTEPVSAQKPTRAIVDIGPLMFCFWRCYPPNYCCVWVKKK